MFLGTRENFIIFTDRIGQSLKGWKGRSTEYRSLLRLGLSLRIGKGVNIHKTSIENPKVALAIYPFSALLF